MLTYFFDFLTSGSKDGGFLFVIEGGMYIRFLLRDLAKLNLSILNPSLFILSKTVSAFLNFGDSIENEFFVSALTPISAKIFDAGGNL